MPDDLIGVCNEWSVVPDNLNGVRDNHSGFPENLSGLRGDSRNKSVGERVIPDDLGGLPAE